LLNTRDFDRKRLVLRKLKPNDNYSLDLRRKLLLLLGCSESGMPQYVQHIN